MKLQKCRLCNHEHGLSDPHVFAQAVVEPDPAALASPTRTEPIAQQNRASVLPVRAADFAPLESILTKDITPAEGRALTAAISKLSRIREDKRVRMKKYRDGLKKRQARK